MTFHDRIHYHQQVSYLAQLVIAMPEYPIYHGVYGGYAIYVDGHCCWFDNVASARLAQLNARGRWLRRHQFPALRGPDMAGCRTFRYDALEA